MNKGRVVLISYDEAKKVMLSEHIIPLGDLRTMYELIDCDCVDCVESAHGKITLWCDDEGLLKPNYAIDVTDLLEDGVDRFMSDVVLAGNLLVTGGADRNGNTMPLPDEITMDYIKSRLPVRCTHQTVS